MSDDIIGSISDPGVTSSPQPSSDKIAAADSGDIIGHISDQNIETSEDHYDTLPQQLLTAGESAASAVTFGASRGLEPLIGKALGTDELSGESQRARQEENPISNVVGGIGGFATGLGAAGAIGAAGTIGAEALGLGSKVAANAIKFGIEGALAGGENEVGRVLTSDPGQGAGSAAINIGLSGLIGGALGGGIGKLSSLWEARYGSKVASALESATEAINTDAPQIPTGVTALADNADELTDAANRLKVKLTPATLLKDKFPRTLEGNLAERGSIPGVAIQREKVAISKQLENAAKSTLEDATEKSRAVSGAGIKKDISETLQENLKPIEQGYKEIEPVLKSVPVPDELKLQAIDPIANHDFVSIDPEAQSVAKRVSSQIEGITDVSSLKKVRSLISSQLNAEYGAGQGGGPKAQILQTAKNALTQMRTAALNAAEESGIIKKGAAQNIRLLDSQYSAFQDTVKQLGVEGGLGRSNNARALLSRFNDLSDEAFTKKVFDTGDVNSLNFFRQNFPEAFEKARTFKLAEIYEKSISHLEGDNGKFSTSKFMTQARKLGPEAQELVFGVENLQKIKDIDLIRQAVPGASDTSRTSYSEAFSKILSPSGLLQNITDAAQYAWLKSLPHLSEAAHLAGGDTAAKLAVLKVAANADKGADPGAYKAIVDYVRSTIHGQNALTRGVKSVFEGGEAIIPRHLVPDSDSRESLQKKLDEASIGDSAVNIGHHVAKYMPDHATAMANTVANASNYLNSLKPTQPTGAALDKVPPVDKAAKARYERALDIAQQPLMVLKHAQNGRLLQDDVKTIRTIYPELHDAMIKKVSDEMIRYKSEGKHIPYAKRVSLNLLVGGNALDSTMTPNAMQSIIKSSTMNQAPQVGSGKTPTGPKTPSKAVISQLNKVDSMYQPRSDARAQDRRS